MGIFFPAGSSARRAAGKAEAATAAAAVRAAVRRKSRREGCWFMPEDSFVTLEKAAC